LKVPDVNVLFQAVNEDSQDHQKARSWLEDALSGTSTTGLAWPALAGFLRLVTNPRVLPKPLAPPEAVSIVESWTLAPGTRLLNPGPQHLQILGRLMVEHDIAGRDISDARLAAIAIEHQATFGTFDSDFHRFAELDLEYLGAR
jgi:toxin-antitoxin system PIN domain toxin